MAYLRHWRENRHRVLIVYLRIDTTNVFVSFYESISTTSKKVKRTLDDVFASAVLWVIKSSTEIV